MAEILIVDDERTLREGMMPKMNGFLCCEEIRKTDRLFVSHRGEYLGVDDIISNLRRKLGPAGDMIANRRGVGCALAH